MSELLSKTQSQRGNAVLFVLLGLVVVALGAGLYLNKDKLVAETGGESTPEQIAQAETGAGDAAAQAAAPSSFKIEQGNPTVAKIGGEEIKRTEVLAYIQNLPANMQQLPAQQLFPLATVQVVNAKLIGEKAATASLDNDPAVKEQLEAVKAQIVRNVFLQKQIDNKLTDERLRATYEQYKAGFPEIQELKARHILVKEEAQAKDLLKQIKDGADFGELAREHSLDGTKESGGELNYVSEQEVVPEFAEAAFALDVGEMTNKPVKTQFGYHIIEVLDKRERPVPDYEVARPFLEAQLRNVVLEETLQEWRQAADVEIYDINGNEFEPAAGEETPAPEVQPEPAAEESPAEETPAQETQAE